MTQTSALDWRTPKLTVLGDKQEEVVAYLRGFNDALDQHQKIFFQKVLTVTFL